VLVDAYEVRTVFNILWLVLAGLWLALAYVLAGVLLCITIIGIPFGLQSFKLAGYALWPFGRTLVPSQTRHKGLSAVGNVLWFLLAGWWLALAHLLTGVLLCLTIIGIPLGVADFKMAGAALVPFGKEVARLKDFASVPPGAIAVPEDRTISP
jgi:uncharacterized membrane protein YccF (DUF307 family)